MKLDRSEIIFKEKLEEISLANFGHGGNVKEMGRNYNMDWKRIIDFSANINPLGMPKSVKDSIKENLEEIEKYPDLSYYELKEAVSEYENKKLDRADIISRDNLILGNGAAEVIYSVVRAINPDKTMILAPTFSEYEESVSSISKEIVIYNLKEDDDFALTDSILKEINDDINMIFICNPNNPTGSIVSKELLIKILKHSKLTNTFVVVDESFLDFIDDDFSIIPCIEEYKNLIVIKSLTKFFALPGLRIGYGLSSNKELCEKISKMFPAWNINILADISARVCLKDEKYIAETIDFMEKERIYLYNELKKVNYLKVYEPSVNFIFFKINKSMELKKELLKRNILIRSCSNYRGLDERYFRIAVKGHEENIKIINALNSIINL